MNICLNAFLSLWAYYSSQCQHEDRLCITKANANKLMPFISVFIFMLDRKEFFKTETKPKISIY
jgi:hypothetical protein